MRVALDTNRLTDLFGGDREIAQLLASCEHIYVPLFTLAEIQAGFAGGNRAADNEALLTSFFKRATVTLLLPDRNTASHYARLQVQLKRAGTPILINHVWIAALALQHDLTLITRDRHFEKIPQLLLG